jgi:hypothetical protein
MAYCYLLLVISVSSLFSTGLANPASGACKAAPGMPNWPTPAEWQLLNSSLAGNLLMPPPPGAVCHPGQATYNATECPVVQHLWTNTTFQVDNPIGTILNNWNNDSCLPEATDPCSGAGYPIYVVNATSAGDVKRGIDFAREHNVRLVVKGSGHDYLGRFVYIVLAILIISIVTKIVR